MHLKDRQLVLMDIYDEIYQLIRPFGLNYLQYIKNTIKNNIQIIIPCKCLEKCKCKYDLRGNLTKLCKLHGGINYTCKDHNWNMLEHEGMKLDKNKIITPKFKIIGTLKKSNFYFLFLLWEYTLPNFTTNSLCFHIIYSFKHIYTS